jgi:hypothetical protein
MMKHTFAKKALLMAAFSILCNITPVHAMTETSAGMSMTVPSMATIREQARTYMSWPKEALQRRLDSLMKFLDVEWKKTMKCLKGEGCTKGQIGVITTTLLAILAIVYVTSIKANRSVEPETKTGKAFVYPYNKAAEAVKHIKKSQAGRYVNKKYNAAKEAISTRGASLLPDDFR